VNILNLPKEVINLITEDVKVEQKVVILVSPGILTHLIREAVATKECMRRKQIILETTITVEVLSGVLCGATLTIQGRIGMCAIQKLQKALQQTHHHPMHQAVLQVNKIRKDHMITEVVKQRQEMEKPVKLGTLTHPIIEAMGTKECMRRKKKVLETTTTAEVQNMVLCGATLPIQRKTGIIVILSAKRKWTK